MITNQLNVLRQSSARAWRIGQTEDCKTVIMYYANTAQEQQVKLMAAKLEAALYLEGSLDATGMSAEADETLEMVIASSFEEA